MQLDILRLQEMMMMRELHQPYSEIQRLPLVEVEFYRETVAEMNKDMKKEMDSATDKAKNMGSRMH